MGLSSALFNFKYSVFRFAFQMFHIVLVIISAACSDTHDKVHNGIKMQDILMWRTLGSKGNPSVICKRPNRSVRAGIHCRHGVVEKFYFSQIDASGYDISFLPNSVTCAHITYSKLTMEVQTRLLPAALVSLNLQNNRIYGTMDLSTLPRPLERLFAMENAITGVVCLKNLPPKLRFIDLSINSIRPTRVYFEKLPETLESIYFKNCGVRRLIPFNDKVDEKGFYIESDTVIAKWVIEVQQDMKCVM